VTEAPSHPIRLTNGMAVALANLAATRGLLTKPVHIRKVSQFIREHLRTIPEFRGEHSVMVAWSDAHFLEITVKERVRDALKELVKSAADKGALSCALGEGDLLVLFGLADEES
jgi:hypothetical protein